MTPRIDMVALSDRGQRRAQNEDSVAAHPVIGLAVLADGMGGHNAGEVASGMATELIGVEGQREVFAEPLAEDEAQALVTSWILYANTEIYAAGRASRERSGMGTTVVVALWHGDAVTIAHVGDSRCYRLRGGTLSRLTRDHTLVQERVDFGLLTAEQARSAPGRNVLTRALGTDATVDVAIETRPVRAADLFLLCSDGLTEMLGDDEIAEVLVSYGESLHAAAQELVRRANLNGGVDNVSVILARALSGIAAV